MEPKGQILSYTFLQKGQGGEIGVIRHIKLSIRV